VGEKRILVVADDPDLRALYRFVLQRGGGYASLEAHGKRSQVEAALWGEPYDLLLLEVFLSLFNGIRLIGEARERLGPHFPIVAIGGPFDHELKARALGAGADRVFHKPLDPHRLVEAVRELLGDGHVAVR